MYRVLTQNPENTGVYVSSLARPSEKVQLLTTDGKEDGEPLLAIDSLGAGVESLVILSNDGASARQMVGHKNSPVRWMVMGICDG